MFRFLAAVGAVAGVLVLSIGVTEARPKFRFSKPPSKPVPMAAAPSSAAKTTATAGPAAAGSRRAGVMVGVSVPVGSAAARRAAYGTNPPASGPLMFAPDGEARAANARADLTPENGPAPAPPTVRTVPVFASAGDPPAAQKAMASAAAPLGPTVYCYVRDGGGCAPF